jgi:serine/threonine protein kinase, bacterial
VYISLSIAGSGSIGSNDGQGSRNVSTTAGSGSLGSADGQGISASFSYPSGIAVDSSGNLFVADTNNHKIRRISSSGLVTTIAGRGSQGSTDGQGTSASFYDTKSLNLEIILSLLGWT